jgi:ACR3 family arsenite transporter
MTKLTLERNQIWFYFIALALGAGWGWQHAGVAKGLESWVAIALGLLLYTTFCQVPLTHLRQAFRHRRFMGALIVGNFVMVPLAVWILAILLLNDPKLQFGVFLVLLVPCTDWFLTFTYLGGGNLPLAIAATPILLLLQSLLLPLYLWLFTAGSLAEIDPTAFVDALVGLILLPLGAALLTEKWAESHPSGERWLKLIAWLPIPLLSLVLLLIAASQVNVLITQPLAPLVNVILIFVAFLVLNGYLARWLGQWASLDPPSNRTLAFSLGTRNSFVVLPFALALPDTWSVVVTIVVVQPLVELTGMIVYLWWVPQRLLKSPPTS